MSDPLRTDPVSAPQPPSDGQRDATIESLLLAGLDHYFAAEYEQAIAIWTRALFLDRGHARARAYIERARSALAEQQRESDELLHKGVAALERGEIETARQLLNTVVARGGAHDAALAGLAHVNRVAAAAHANGSAGTTVTRPPAARVAPAIRRSKRGFVGLLLLVLTGAGIYGMASWEKIQTLIPALPPAAGTEPAPVRAGAVSVIIPRSSEMAFDHAQAFHASGRLYDALRALELVRATDPLRADADKLKAQIQRQLLAHPAAAEPVLAPPPASSELSSAPTVP